MLVEKVNGLLTRTIKAKGILAANAMVSFCPSSLQTANMLSTKDIKGIIPLVNESEWERYIAMPRPLQSGVCKGGTKQQGGMCSGKG